MKQMPDSVGLRASKDEFMYALGLDARNREHDRYYQAMRVRYPPSPSLDASGDITGFF